MRHAIRLAVIAVLLVAMGCQDSFVGTQDPASVGQSSFDIASKSGTSASSLGVNGAGAMVPDDPSLDMTTAVTIAAWVYFDSYFEWASVVTKGRAAANESEGYGPNNYTLHQSGVVANGPYNAGEGGHMRFTGLGVDPGSWDSATQIPLNEWHFVAVTFDGSSIRFYLDGKPDGAYDLGVETSLGPNDGPLNIGFDPPGIQEYWDGRLDQVRVWNEALSAGNIRAAMNLGATPRAMALVGFWNFDEAGGSAILDQSGNGNDGELLPGAARIPY